MQKKQLRTSEKPPELSMSEQLENLARHHDLVSIEISKNTLMLLNSFTLPVQSLIVIYKKQQELLETQAMFNSMGMTMFGGQWVERNKSRILSREGKPLEKTPEPCGQE